MIEYLDSRYAVDAVADPQWDSADKCHDWRHHVGHETAAIWDTFTTEQRLAIAADAQKRANDEEWD